MLDILKLLNDMAIPVCIIAIAFLIIVWISDIVQKNKKKQYKLVKRGKTGKAHGIIFGKKGSGLMYSPTDDEGSCGVFSGTGTGKTTAVGIPTLRSWRGRFFAIDISGDILKNCPNVKKRLIFNPEGAKSHPFNVFSVIDRLKTSGEKNQALAQLAILIMPEDETINSNANARFFYRGGRNILTAALITFYYSGMDFCDICIKVVTTPWKSLFAEIDKSKCDAGIAYINGFDPDRPQDAAGSMQDCIDAVSLFATNENVKKWVRRPKEGETAITPWAIENFSIFVVIDDPLLDLYAPLLNLCVSLQMQYISNRKVTDKSKELLLYLDEYASLKISSEIILQAVRKYRKRHCRVMILTQNIADLNILYGDNVTRAILSNLRFKELLGGLGDTESQKYFAELIGYKDTKKYSHSKSSRDTTITDSEQREYKIEPAELDTQGDDVAILILPENEGYIKLKKNYYWKK